MQRLSARMVNGGLRVSADARTPALQAAIGRLPKLGVIPPTMDQSPSNSRMNGVIGSERSTVTSRGR